MPEFLFDPSGHGRLVPTTCEKYEILEIYDLGENGQVLVQLFRENRWSIVGWDKPESAQVDGLTCFLNVGRGDVTEAHDDGTHRYPEECLGLEVALTACSGLIEQVCKEF